MDRIIPAVAIGIVLSVVNCEDVTTVSPKVIHWNETGICRKCVCKDAKVNCFDKSLDKFFSKEEWTNLKEFKPTIVDLSENPITEVTALAELPVKVLNLSRCSIESIERASFKDLLQMEVLDLSYNKLTYVNLSPHAFEGRYSPEDFEALASMRILNLSYNDLHYLHPDLFLHLPKLTELNINGNPLRTINHGTHIAISSLPKMKGAYRVYNFVEFHIFRKCFNRLSSLPVIMAIETLPKYRELNKIINAVLKMSSCGFNKIPDKLFHTTRFLEHLDISNNKLISVPNELEECRNLKYLNLNQNPIVKLDMSSEEYPGFPRLLKLQELHMCNMEALTSIGEGALAGLENLKKLHISFNPKLSFMDPKALARPDDIGETYDWPLIKELYLQSNNLSDVDFHLVSRWDLLDKVDVSNNPFLCDCSTQWMLDILVPVVESKVVNGSELMVCEEPTEMKGYTMKHLHEIDHTMSCVDKYGNRLEKDGALSLRTLDATTAPPEVKSWNETGVCRKCVSKDAKVNYFYESLDKFFSKEEWTNLKEFKPKVLDISGNPITKVTALAELPVKVLNLSRCSIESIENASFKDLQEMEVLDLSYNKLTSAKLRARAFEGRYALDEDEPLASMRILNLACNDLNSLQKDLFEYLPNLIELNINGNPLRTIDHGTHIAISSLPKMKILKMSSCGFDEIPEKLFHTTRPLEHLDISDNKLTSVPKELEEARNLKYLNLNQNPIVKLDMSSKEYPGFPRLLKLQELHMCNMEALTSIGAGALAGLENLKKLHMSFNPKLSFIDPKALARPDDIGETYDWPLIKELYLQSNNLSEVDFHLVSRWDLLDKVDVSNNPFLCDCSTQWMLDIVVPVVESKVVNGSELMVCKEPTEMKGYTMKYLHEIEHTMSCVDKYGNRLKKDGAMSLKPLNATTVPPKVIHWNETSICRKCVCKDAKVNCFDESLDKFFSIEEWTNLKEFKPTIIDLSENPIIEVTALAELPVKVLNLSRCSIESIERASFKDLQQILEVLDLSYNKLTGVSLDPDAFEGRFRYSPEDFPLASMRILNLAYNDLHYLHPDLFLHLPKLTELNINGNPLRTINLGTQIAISNLPKMKVLKMSSCGFNEIPEKFLHTSSLLEHLDISDNKLTSVPDELAEGRNLKYLNLNQNPIVKLDMFSAEYPGFPRLLKLQELHMCNMEALTSIGEGALAGLENLKKLHMSFNPKLSFIDPKALARLDDISETYDWPLIKELYLQSNNLSDVDFHLVSRWDLLDKVDVSNNPFLCDCSTQWMLDILVPVVESKVVNGSEMMVCKEPTEMKGYTMKHLHEIDHTMSCVDKYGNRLEKDGALSSRTLNATTAPPEVKSWNETGICRKCVCKDAKVNCFDESLDKFFSKKEWTNLQEFKPTVVDLSDNPITKVTALAELPVKVLNLSRCSIESIENASFKDLQEMEVLDLSYNKLTSAKLRARAFEGRYALDEDEPLASMRILNLAYNDLNSLQKDLFEYLPNLIELNINGNPLRTIDHGTHIAISSLPKMKVFKMSSCGFDEIPEKFFHTTRLLEHLDISDNKLTSVPKEIEEARNLKYLNLSQNPIVKLDMSSEEYPGFPRLLKLQELHMCNMEALTSIGAGALSGLENLKKLHISFNPKLSFIDPKALARPDDIGETYDWPLIKELYLQSNNLSEVDFHLVSRWELLDKVDVSNNPFLCDCSTQWMLDILVPVVESKVVNASELMVCKEPTEMKGYTMKHLHEIHRNTSCVDKYGNRLEKDGAMSSRTLNATTVPSKVIHWNETDICRKCVCKDAKVNCFDESLDKFFSKEEWTNLKEFKPTIVDLSENPIIEVTALAELPVKVLNLSRCSIESIERASFKDLQQIEVLDLSYNKLTYVNLSPHAFEGRYSSEKYEPLASMRTLNLAYNDLHSLNQDLFEHLPELTELNLNGNPLTTIDLVTLIAISSLPMLKVLKMRSCGLTEIPEKFLHTPKFLEHLDFSDNKLISLPEELKEARNLKYLNLNQNPIVKLDMSSKDYPGFPRLRKLQELHMSNMKALTSIGAGALSGLVNLKKLHMSFNPKLSFIDPKALARPGYIGETYEWPLIKELYLQSNNLPEVDFHLVFRWDSLDKVDVSNNPFLCDCSTQWMLDILVPVVESKVVNGSELMVCKEPIEMKGYTMKHLHEIHRNMSCVDQYGNRLEIDVAMLLGTLIGVLLAVPIMFTLLLLWRRGLCAWMGLRGPQDVSSAFYKRAPADDNYI